MPRPPVTPQQRTEMRQHIQASVARIIKQRQIAPGDVRGWDDITIRDVISDADISIGTFYKYFDSRRELAQSMWLEPVAELREVMQVDFNHAKGASSRIQTLLENYVRFAIENQRVFRGALLFVRPDSDPKPELVDLDEEAFYENLRSAFREGQEQGDFRSFDAHEMAQLFWAAIHGALALPIHVDRYKFDPPPVLSANMINALLSMIRA
ncbi:MAG: TetR/AcrR family transcriptional regulator [Pseudomonadota bacterium]